MPKRLPIEELQDLLQSNIQTIALDIYEADKSPVYGMIAQVAKSLGIEKIYSISLANKVRTPVYDQRETSLIVNWDSPKEFQVSDRVHLVNHCLQFFRDYQDNGIFVFEDWQPYLEQNTFNPTTWSLIKAVSQELMDNINFRKIAIFLGQDIRFRGDLLRQVPVVKVPLPSVSSIEDNLIALGMSLGVKDQSHYRELAQAASGLACYQIAYLLDVVTKRSGDKVSQLKDLLVETKCEILKAMGVKYIDCFNIPDVGGHSRFKDWMSQVEQRNANLGLGLPPSRGALLAGVPGTGKTLLAKYAAKKLGLPLVLLSIPSLKNALVGKSEENLRKVLDLISKMKVVILLDEIDKVVSSNSVDASGVTSGMFSILLSWMQEENTNFIICTANNVAQIPPELIRAGRLDKRWFVDLPGDKDRESIVKIYLTAKYLHDGQELCRCDLEGQELADLISLISAKTLNYTGSELEELVIQALVNAHIAGRSKRPTSADFVKAQESVRPVNEFSGSKRKLEMSEYGRSAEPTSMPRITKQLQLSANS